jgi:diguanylate cyclase
MNNRKYPKLYPHTDNLNKFGYNENNGLWDRGESMKKLPVKDKLNLLANTTIFSRLKKEELLIVLENGEIINFKENDKIYEAGSIATELYIIISGEVLITKTTSENRKIDLARFITGECFGELDLFTDTTRKTGAEALKSTSLFIFPKKGLMLNDVLKMHPALSAQILHKFLILIAERIRNTNKLISEKTPWIEDLRKQLHRDKLTGLYNKTYLEDELPEIMEKNQKFISLVMIKPDNFKEINDEYGHEKGDLALKFMANHISLLLGENCIFVRYKGDEYVIVIINSDNEKTAELAQKIKTSISSCNIKEITSGKDFFITVSIGMSSNSSDKTNSKVLLDTAYENMIKAKNTGGNRIVY